MCEMSNVKFDLVNNQNEREIIINEERLDVFDKVKESVFIKGTEYMTIQQVADYYNVGYKVIKSLINEHKEELTKNGYKLVSGKDLKEILASRNMKFTNKKGYFECNGEKFSNRNNGLFNKRSILNVSMLLKDSPVAKEVRTLLLDNHEQPNNIHKKLDNSEKITKKDINKSDPLYFVNREKELRQQELEIAERLTKSIVNGDMASYMSINCEMNKIKEDLIALGKEKDELNKTKVSYYDMVLKSKGLVTATQIAKDYGMSGRAFNKKLHELGIQYKQGTQWLLYSNYQDKGWTQSETYCNGDNSYITTKWTQKGRQGLYELLKEKGILPLIEQTA